MTPSEIEPPTDVPREVTEYLEESSDSELRTLIHYAQRLLREHPTLTDAVESREGEELVHKEDHGAYTLVVVERPDETGAARGPYAYHVRWEPEMDSAGGKYKWHYLGKVHGKGGGDSDD